jgi:hypothetical protein
MLDFFEVVLLLFVGFAVGWMSFALADLRHRHNWSDWSAVVPERGAGFAMSSCPAHQLRTCVTCKIVERRTP